MRDRQVMWFYMLQHDKKLEGMLPLAITWAELPWESFICRSILEELTWLMLNSSTAISIAIFCCFPINEAKSSTAPMLILVQLFGTKQWLVCTLDHANKYETILKQIMSCNEEFLPIPEISIDKESDISLSHWLCAWVLVNLIFLTFLWFLSFPSPIILEY